MQAAEMKCVSFCGEEKKKMNQLQNGQHNLAVIALRKCMATAIIWLPAVSFALMLRWTECANNTHPAEQ
jgi:hypothetical protein